MKLIKFVVLYLFHIHFRLQSNNSQLVIEIVFLDKNNLVILKLKDIKEFPKVEQTKE